MNAKAVSAPSNNRFTPYTDPKIVVAYLDPFLQQLRQFFVYACSRAVVHFAERGWSPDPNLFAYEVRKDVFERLKAMGADVTETDDSNSDSFNLERMALCGLLLKLQLIHLRVRKSEDNEIPPAGSEQLLGFYNWNLFAFDEPPEKGDPTPLHLVLLWNLDSVGNLTNFWLVCPRGERAREVRWYWQELVAIDSEQDKGAEEFRSAFREANSDVPISPKDKHPRIQRGLSTGTDKQKS